ncbi:MAG: hypothetical protein V7643_1590 [Mycobacterium sp.]
MPDVTARGDGREGCTLPRAFVSALSEDPRDAAALRGRVHGDHVDLADVAMCLKVVEQDCHEADRLVAINCNGHVNLGIDASLPYR